jgi:hypothetical protein
MLCCGVLMGLQVVVLNGVGGKGQLGYSKHSTLPGLQFVKKYRAKVNISFSIIFLVKTLVTLAFAMHLFACLWLLCE